MLRLVRMKDYQNFSLNGKRFGGGCTLCNASIMKLANICTAVVWIFALSLVGFHAYLELFTDSITIRLSPLISMEEHSYKTVMIIINLTLMLYIVFAWITPSALMFVFCKILANEFSQVKQTIMDLNRQGHVVLIRNLEGVRQHHEKLCVLVGYADNLFSTQIAVSFVGSVSITCLTLYIFIVDTNSSMILTLTQCVFLVAAVVKVLSDCISGATVNGPLARYTKLRVRMRRECRERFPRHRR